MRAFGVLLPLVFLLLLGSVVYAIAQAARTHGPHAEGDVDLRRPAPVDGAMVASRRGIEGAAPATHHGEIAHDLDRWIRAGLISDQQRSAILAHERTLMAPEPGVAVPVAPDRPRRIPAVAEALGYLGGMLAVVGLGLIVSRYWPDMATAGRLAMSGATALALVAAGALAREQADPALARLRWFLWLAATAATALFAGVVTVDGLDAAPETVALACGGAVALLSGLLWRGRERPLQQLTFLGGLVVTTGALVSEVVAGVPIGLAVWVVGVTFLVLGLRRMIALPVLTEGVGALAVLAGAVITVTDSQSFGLLFVIASAFGLLALASVGDLAPERADRVPIGVVGGVALVQAVPSALGWFSHDAGGATGLTTWVIGALLLFVGARGRTRLPLPTELLGGAGLIGGAALTWVQWHGAAPILGIATAVALVGLGTLPGQVLLSVLGSVGLLINVPWAIGWFFPGEGRAPLLIMVSGALIIAVAVLLTRMGGRLRQDLGSMRHGRPPGGGVIPGASH
jgi:hypothetical protein